MSPVLEHILVATDFSSPSKRAASAAAVLARVLPTTPRITLFNAVAPLPLGRMSPFVPFGTSEEELEADLRKRARDELRALREECFGDDLEVQILEGSHRHPAIAVCDTAEQLEADLIVSGTHGLSGVKRAVFGSVAARVMRHATTDVLLIPGEMDLERFPPKRIVAATDFSRPAGRAVQTAGHWARTFSAALELLHVVTLGPVRQAGFGWAFPPDLARLAKTMTEEAERQMNRRRTEWLGDLKDVTARATVGTMAIERSIIEHAEESGASLIVAGSVGRTGMQRLLLGSVAEGLGRASAVPVLCVRTGAA